MFKDSNKQEDTTLTNSQPAIKLAKNDEYPTNQEDIRAGIELILPEGSICEMRIPNTGSMGTISGFYKDREALLKRAAKFDRKEKAIFVTLNPVKEELYRLRPDSIEARAKNTARDKDIVKRVWLPLDFDPIRPSGVSSTDEEHESAVQCAERTKEWLTECGWPEPVFADSGNGTHLLYHIDLPNDEASTKLVKDAIAALSARFSDEKVEIDKSVRNAARIFKLYGTWTRKGDNTQERPHRRSKIIHQPDILQIVSSDLIEEIAKHAPNKESGSGDANVLGKRITEAGFEVSKKGEWGDGYRFELKACPWNPDHTNGSAYIIQFKSGAKFAGCHHHGCTDKGWRDLPELHGRDDKDGNDSEKDTRSNEEKLLELLADTEVFKIASETPYVRFKREEVLIDARVSSALFQDWMGYIYFEQYGKGPSDIALKKVTAHLTAKARFDGEAVSVYKRVARVDHEIHIDLGRDDRKTVKITSDHPWEIVSYDKVRFERFQTTGQLPDPVSGGRIELLRPFVNVANEHEWQLLVYWMLMVLGGKGPFPTLMINGPQGSAKSTLCRILRRLLDPTGTSGVQTIPDDLRNLFVTIDNSYLVVFDNVSHLTKRISDALCQIATNADFRMRELYTNNREYVVTGTYPLCLNGIEDFVNRPDLRERSVFIELKPIDAKHRRDEEKFASSAEFVGSPKACAHISN